MTRKVPNPAAFSPQHGDMDLWKCVYDYTGNNNQIAGKFSFGELLFEKEIRQEKYEYITEGIDYCAVLHIHLSVGIGVEQQDAEKDAIR